MNNEAAHREASTEETKRFQRLFKTLGFLLLGASAAYLVYYATAWGPWAFSDATGYIVGARNLLAGHGIGRFSPSGEFSLGTGHPPLFPLSLGVVGLFGPAPLHSARLLDVVLFAIFVAGGGYGLYRFTKRVWLGLALSGLFLLQHTLVIAFLSAMSEPLFLVTGFASLYFGALYIIGSHRIWWIASVAASSLALLTRYAGAAFVATGALALLILLERPMKARVREAVAYGLFAILPIGAFLAWTSVQPNVEAPRALQEASLGFGGVATFFQRLVGAIWQWKPVPPDVLLPTWAQTVPVPELIFLLSIAVFTAILGITWRKLRGALAFGYFLRRNSPTLILLAICFLFLLTYTFFFGAVYVVSDPTPDIDSRTMLPLLPAFLIALVCIIDLLIRTWDSRPAIQFALAAILAPAFLGYGILSQDIYAGLHRTGLGYTGRDWRQSETIAYIETLPTELPIVTNETEPILLLTGRTPYPIAELVGADVPSEFHQFGVGDSEAEARFHGDGAALVLFDTIEEQMLHVYGERATKRLEAFTDGLRLAFEGEDGKAYFWP